MSQHASSEAAQRDVLRRATRWMLVYLAALAVLGALVGGLVDGAAGVWGAAIGVVGALVFSGTTIASMRATVGADLTRTAAVVLGAWLAKIVVVILALVAVRGTTFASSDVLGIVLVLGAIGTAYADYLAVSRGRIPYVEPGAADGS